MKTTKLFSVILIILTIGSLKGNAQATQGTNAITSGSYLGTSNAFDVVFKRSGASAGLLSTSTTSFGVGSSAIGTSVAIGSGAGNTSTGDRNTFLGFLSGSGSQTPANNTGTDNTFIGHSAGINISNGSNNCFIGRASGFKNTTGSSNTFLGYNSGFAGGGSSGNVCLGANAGLSSAQSTQTITNQLFIDNSQTATPLIWGDFSVDQLKLNGKVGIGGNSTTGFGNYPTTAGGVNVSAYQLFVKGGILTEEVRVSLATTWADYVFNKDYNLKPLSEVEKFIKDNGHLPNVPSAAQVKEDGIALGEMAKIQQEKIEELTLYIIELNKKLEGQQKQINALMQDKK